MLPQMHRIPRSSGCSLVRRRWNSSVAIAYHPKVRALPFVATPQETLSKLSVHASMALVRDNYTWLPALLARYLPGMGWGEMMLPEKFQPVYLPAWVLDGWLSLRREDKQKGEATYLGIDSSHIPGLGHYPLSGMALVDPAHENFEPVPFTNDLRKQHDLDVLCLPYTFTPTDIPAWIRSAKLGYDPIQDHNLQTIRSAVTWYPVLLPVYLATYKAVLQGLTYSITFAVEGFRKKGTHWMDTSELVGVVSKIQADSEGSAVGFGLGFLQHSIPEDIVASKSPGSSFIRTQSVSRVSMDPLLSGGVELQEQLRGILDSWVHGKGLWSKYEKFWRRQHGRTNVETTDFDDPRISECMDQSRVQNQLYATSTFFREMLGTKIEMSLRTASEGVTYCPFELPAIRGEWVSSYKPLTPEGGYEVEGDVPEVHITIPLNMDKAALVQTKMPIIVKIVHDNTLLGRVHVQVTTSDQNSGSSHGDTASDQGTIPRSLDAEIRWRNDDLQARERVDATMKFFSVPRVPLVEVWEKKNLRT